MDYRIGKDLHIRWNLLFRESEFFPVTGYSSRLFFVTGRGRNEVPAEEYTLTDGRLEWTFKAEKQYMTGAFTLELMLSKGEEFRTGFLAIHAFSLMLCGDTSGEVEITSFAERYFSLEARVTKLEKNGGGGGIVDCDAFLSLTSENPVQNKVITGYLKMIDTKVTLTASASYIFSDRLTNVTLSVTASGITGTADKIEIFKADGTRVGGNTNSNSYSISVPLSATTTYYAIVTAYGGATKQSDAKTVSAVGHIYYGSGSSKEDFWSNKVARASAVGSPSGTYSVTIRNEGDVFYFTVPSNMTITTAKLDNLLNVPLKAADTTTYSGFKLYEGSNTMQKGTYSITLS